MCEPWNATAAVGAEPRQTEKRVPSAETKPQYGELSVPLRAAGECIARAAHVVDPVFVVVALDARFGCFALRIVERSAAHAPEKVRRDGDENRVTRSDPWCVSNPPSRVDR